MKKATENEFGNSIMYFVLAVKAIFQYKNLRKFRLINHLN